VRGKLVDEKRAKLRFAFGRVAGLGFCSGSLASVRGMSSKSGTAHEPSEECHEGVETSAGPSKDCMSVSHSKQASYVRWAKGMR